MLVPCLYVVFRFCFLSRSKTESVSSVENPLPSHLSIWSYFRYVSVTSIAVNDTSDESSSDKTSNETKSIDHEQKDPADWADLIRSFSLSRLIVLAFRLNFSSASSWLHAFRHLSFSFSPSRRVRIALVNQEWNIPYENVKTNKKKYTRIDVEEILTTIRKTSLSIDT